MNKKENNKVDFETASLIIALFLAVMFFVIIIVENPKGKKEDAEAYTNNIVSYANEQITDLTGTSWEFNEISSDIWDIGDINFISNNETFTKISFNYEEDRFGNFAWKMYYNNTNVSTYGSFPMPAPYGDYKIISITGGEDTTNSDLIYWLQTNATQLVNEEFYNITYNLQNVLVIGEKPTQISNLEEINIEFQNFNNYELPQNIMIENASYNWNNETGILTIYNATGNVNITIRAEYISGNYSFIELIDSVVLIPLNTFFNLFNFDIFGVNIYALLTATLTLFVIIKILLKVFK